MSDEKIIKKAIMDYYHEGHVQYKPELYDEILHDDWKFFYFNREGVLELVDKATYKSWYNPKDRDDVRDERMVRIYIEHWNDIPKPIDARVIEAVQKGMQDRRLVNGRITYHQEFLRLVHAPEPKLLNPRETAEATLKALATGQETPLIRWTGARDSDAGHRKEAEQALGRSIDYELPYEPGQVTAVAQGQPLVMSAPASVFSQSIFQIARLL